MDFAILAAGEGSRLKEEGVRASKPIVKLGGMSLIQRLINIFLQNGAERVVVVINEHSPDVEAFFKTTRLPVPLYVVRKDTASSLHSFYELLPYLNGDRVCLTTVDTVFQEDVFASYIAAFKQTETYDALMAVTSFVDDESPLYVQTDGTDRVTAFLDKPPVDECFVSGGIYSLRKNVFPLVRKAVEGGTTRMRNFQRLLIEEGLYVQAYPFPKIIDIDHVHDLQLAEAWLQNEIGSNT